LGTGRLFPFDLNGNNSVQHGATFYVLNGSTVVEITSGGTDAGKARAVLNEVIASLKRA
jgi:hypothetical protein